MSWTFLSAAHFRTWVQASCKYTHSSRWSHDKLHHFLVMVLPEVEKKALRCSRCRRNLQYTPGQKRKPWEDVHTAAPFFKRITCLQERDGTTLPNLNLPSWGLLLLMWGQCKGLQLRDCLGGLISWGTLRSIQRLCKVIHVSITAGALCNSTEGFPENSPPTHQDSETTLDTHTDTTVVERKNWFFSWHVSNVRCENLACTIVRGVS